VQGNVTADRSVLLQNENESSGHLALFADKRSRPHRLVGEPEWRTNLGGEDRAQVPPGPTTQFGVTQIGSVELPGSPSLPKIPAPNIPEIALKADSSMVSSTPTGANFGGTDLWATTPVGRTRGLQGRYYPLKVRPGAKVAWVS
jgi:hypothetical protein